jgi:MFS family permease
VSLSSVVPPKGAFRVVVTGSLFNSLAFFSVVPFLTLHLAQISTLSSAAIGAVVGSIALISACGGLLGGVLADRFGATALVSVGLMIYNIAFVGLALTRVLPLVIALIAILGVGRMMVEPSLKRLLSLSSRAGGDLAFRARYTTVSVGAMVGPPLGAVLYSRSRGLMFGVSALLSTAYLGYLRIHQASLRRLDQEAGGSRRSPHGRWQALKDVQLRYVVVGATAVWFVFSQLESTFPLYLRSVRGPSAMSFFAVVLAAHAALGIALQLPIARLSRGVSQTWIAFLGSLGFACAFLLWQWLDVSLVFLMIGLLLWTVGEALLLPLPEVILHRLAPDDQKGAYFGLAELRYLGFFFGPVVEACSCRSAARRSSGR